MTYDHRILREIVLLKIAVHAVHEIAHPVVYIGAAFPVLDAVIKSAEAVALRVDLDVGFQVAEMSPLLFTQTRVLLPSVVVGIKMLGNMFKGHARAPQGRHIEKNTFIANHRLQFFAGFIGLLFTQRRKQQLVVLLLCIGIAVQVPLRLAVPHQYDPVGFHAAVRYG